LSIQVQTWRQGNALATNVALLLLGLLTIELCRTGVGEFHHFVHGYSETVFGQLAIYLGAISLTERCPVNKWTLWIILAIALAARLICIAAPPFLSTDVYRYVWDGKVQAAGINPFRYIPADSHLAFLREGSIYPSINRKETAHTIYPPAAEAIFFAVARLRATVPFMKLSLVAFEAVTCFLLIKIFKILGLPRERIVLYAWHPLCFWEIASSGHIDAAALTFLTLAIYARMRDQPSETGLWLGIAALTKMYPAALLPAFFQSAKCPRFKWKMPAMFAIVVGLGYTCYSSVGSAIFGYLPGYAQEEGLESGDRYFLLSLANRTSHITASPLIYIGVAATCMIGLSIWALRRGSKPYAFIFSALVIATMLNIFYSPHYPWYFLWLLPYVAIIPWRPAFYLIAASTYLFGTNLGAPGEPMHHLNVLLYSGFAFMLAYDFIARQSKRSTFGLVANPTKNNPSLVGVAANVRNL
jgi:alpha-1,6-mannosyltransferase